jgi:hypothetical protein
MKMNSFVLLLTKEAKEDLKLLASDKGRIRTYIAVAKALRLMSQNLRHPSLATHEFRSKQGPNGEKILESYAQNKTPSAHRIFWYYGPGKKEITVVAITPHP